MEAVKLVRGLFEPQRGYIQVGELLGERQHHDLEHELQREEGVVLGAAHQMEDGGRLVEHAQHLRLVDLGLVAVGQLDARELLERVRALRRQQLLGRKVRVAHCPGKGSNAGQVRAQR